MIEKKLLYVVKCNACGKYYSGSENEFDCFETEKEAMEIIKDDWQVKGKKVFCENCRTY